MIDHTLLKPDATREQLKKVCDEAKKYHFATVCVNSSNIPFVSRELKGSGVKPIAVVGFPLGAASPQSKAFEAKEAIKNGAEEIDMVINIGALKSKDYVTVYRDILAVVEASKPHKVKVILETSNLDHDEKVIACALSKTAGAAFVKTSTGFGSGGATVEDIALMRKIVGSDMEVKASGGIRSTEDAKKMIAAGADRIGASASIAIVTGTKAKGGKY
ncbi:MAG: deoxyribose-phosphate aldolase [Gammaproteobacteria bacterium]